MAIVAGHDKSVYAIDAVTGADTTASDSAD